MIFSKLARGYLHTLCLSLLFLTACSSGSPDEPTNTAPSVNAGADQTVTVGAMVDLAGNATDAEGDNLTYTWSFTDKPDGSDAAFDDDDNANARFTPDVVGEYEVRLSVSDGNLTGSDSLSVTATEADDPGNPGSAADGYENAATTLTSTPSAGDFFGDAVAISGDTALVGAPREESVGFAYFYTRGADSSWGQPQRVSASTPSGRFGSAVSVSGDTAFIAAPFNVPGIEDGGSVFVFERSGGTWSEVQKLKASDVEEGQFFGDSVAVSGDYAFVGAPRDDGAEQDEGAAYVFERSGGSWAQVQKLTLTGTALSFGRAVAVSGTQAVVSTQREDQGESILEGTAYVYERTDGSWNQTAQLMPATPKLLGEFGDSVAIDGNTIVVGQETDTSGADGDGGAAYIFVKTADTWSQSQKIKANDAVEDAQFGSSVAVAGDYILVGAPYNSVADFWGAAYLFQRDDSGFAQTNRYQAVTPADNDGFGYAVALDAGGALIGAPYSDDGAGGDNAGAAYTVGRSAAP